jgi:hypothetical protein
MVLQGTTVLLYFTQGLCPPGGVLASQMVVDAEKGKYRNVGSGRSAPDLPAYSRR